MRVRGTGTASVCRTRYPMGNMMVGMTGGFGVDVEEAMPVRLRFQQNATLIPGVARTGAHTPDWSDPRIGDPGTARNAIPEVGDEILVGFETSDHPSASLGSWAKLDGLDVSWHPAPRAQTKGPANLTGEIVFTRSGQRGSEVADLRVQLHDIRILSSERVSRAGSLKPVERIVIACSKMTPAGTPRSASDISQQVRAKVATAQAGRHHAGGIIVAMGDGSVRFVR